MPKHPDHEIYLIRHGETEWARDGRHTGRTDIPLTETGRTQAEFLLPIFQGIEFEAILSSPLQRAYQTACLAGLKGRIELSDGLLEWDYGDYEGITSEQIREKVPNWTVWTHPCPNGERIEQVSARADRVIARCEQIKGNVALFSHGHFLRVLVSRWIGLPPDNGRHFLLDTSTLSILAYEREVHVIRTWNGSSSRQRAPSRGREPMNRVGLSLAYKIYNIYRTYRSYVATRWIPTNANLPNLFSPQVVVQWGR